jgi:hypothetical protein
MCRQNDNPQRYFQRTNEEWSSSNLEPNIPVLMIGQGKLNCAVLCNMIQTKYVATLSKIIPYKNLFFLSSISVYSLMKIYYF